MDEQEWKPEPKITDKQLVKFITIVFVAVVYLYMFLKIMFLD